MRRTVTVALLLAMSWMLGCSGIPGVQTSGSPAPSPSVDPGPPGAPIPLAASIPDTVFIYDLDEVPNLTVLLEVLQRGFTKWGCRPLRLRQATWTPPTEGSPVERYVFEYTTTFTWVSDTTLTIPWPTYAEAGAGSTWARVAGVDSLDRQGPWSEPSDIEFLEVE